MSSRSLLPIIALLSACTGSALDDVDFKITSDAGTVIDGEFIIGGDLDTRLQGDMGLVQLDYDAVLGAGLYRAETGATRTALEAVLRDTSFEAPSVEENRTVSALTNDTYRDLQWNLDLLNIDDAWATSTGAGVTVAVIDSGVSSIGRDTPIHLIAGWDYVDDDADPSDENGHGTHVAGTIAQATDNGIGVAGVAPDANILAIRVLDRWGSGSVYWSAKAISYAVDNGADVINMSLGSPSGSSIEADAVNYALGQGVVVVAATGNDGGNIVDYPGAYPGVLAVGAVGANGQVASYSTGGNAISLVAPGGELHIDRNGDGYGDGILQETLSGSGTSYQFFEGTSMATPHVAAAAALLIGAGANGSDVGQILIETADDIGSAGWDTRSGYGLINPVAALATLVTVAPPGTTATAPSDPGTTADTTAPVIRDVTGTRDSTNMTLTWTTDEPASTEVEFEDYGLFGDPNARTTTHEMSFYVDDTTTYYFTLVATDAEGNTGQNGQWYMAP
jgi:serine protease